MLVKKLIRGSLPNWKKSKGEHGYNVMECCGFRKVGHPGCSLSGILNGLTEFWMDWRSKLYEVGRNGWEDGIGWGLTWPVCGWTRGPGSPESLSLLSKPGICVITLEIVIPSCWGGVWSAASCASLFPVTFTGCPLWWPFAWSAPISLEVTGFPDLVLLIPYVPLAILIYRTHQVS